MTEIEPYVTAVDQDPGDPIWASDADISAMTDTEHQDSPAIRNSSGIMEFLEGFVDQVRSFLEDDPGPQVRQRQGSPVSTRERGSDSWRGRTAALQANIPNKLIVRSDRRRKVTIVNTGASSVYLSSTSANSTGQPNQFVLQAQDPTKGFANSITLTTRDDVYGIASADTTITLVEEFDY